MYVQTQIHISLSAAKFVWLRRTINEVVWSNVGMILNGKTEVLGEEHYTACVVDE